MSIYIINYILKLYNTPSICILIISFYYQISDWLMIGKITLLSLAKLSILTYVVISAISLYHIDI